MSKREGTEALCEAGLQMYFCVAVVKSCPHIWMYLAHFQECVFVRTLMSQRLPWSVCERKNAIPCNCGSVCGGKGLGEGLCCFKLLNLCCPTCSLPVYVSLRVLQVSCYGLCTPLPGFLRSLRILICKRGTPGHSVPLWCCLPLYYRPSIRTLASPFCSSQTDNTLGNICIPMADPY